MTAIFHFPQKTSDNLSIIEVKRKPPLGSGGFGIVNAATLYTDFGKAEKEICLKQVC